MAFKIILKIPGIRPLYINPDGSIWASQREHLLFSEDGIKPFIKVASFQLNLLDVMAKMSRLAERLFRSGFHHAVPLLDGNMLAVSHRRMLKADLNKGTIHTVFPFPRGSRSLSTCRTPDGKLFFGEYFGNKDRESVNIYGSFDNGDSWEIVYTFPPKTVRHIHGIYHDPFRSGCWILTGDSNSESKILFTEDYFRNVEVVAHGSQNVRAVSVIPMQDGLLVPTDTPLENNYVQWLDPKTGGIEKVFPLPGSAFYSASVGEYKVISTVVEPSKVNRCEHAMVFFSKDGFRWKELYRQKKDIWSMRYFQYGALVLPPGKNSKPYAYAYGQALEKNDNTLLCWNLEECWQEID